MNSKQQLLISRYMGGGAGAKGIKDARGDEGGLGDFAAASTEPAGGCGDGEGAGAKGQEYAGDGDGLSSSGSSEDEDEIEDGNDSGDDSDNNNAAK